MLPSDPPSPAVSPPPSEAGWQRLHRASPILNGITTAIRFWPIFLVAVFNEGGGLTSGILIAGVLVVMLIVEAVRYLRFDYRLEGTTLVVRSGVLVRNKRTVPADRVQQVSRNQKLRHRVFNVAELFVEVAGSGSEPDIKLSVVDAAEAERLRIRLQDARRAVGSAPPEPDHVAYELPNRSLLRWAAFSSPLFMIPAVGAGFGALTNAVDPERVWDWVPAGTGLAFFAAVGLIGLAAATAVNVARFYDMRLVEADDNFRLEYGLLTHRRLELATDRIQAIVTRLTPAGRLAGTIGVTAHNASSAGEATNSYMPAVPQADRAVLVAKLIPHISLDEPLQRHPRAALRRSVIRWTRPVVLVATIAAIATRAGWAYALFLTVPFAAALGWRAWSRLGHAATAETVLARRGAISEHTAAVRRSRIQSVSLAANWFQRRLGLATMQIEVAQPLGRVTIRDMDGDRADRLAARLAEIVSPQVVVARSEDGEGKSSEQGEQRQPLEP